MPTKQTLRLGAFANDGNIGLQTEHGVELSMQGHAAIPSRKPHAANPAGETVAHHHHKGSWSSTADSLPSGEATRGSPDGRLVSFAGSFVGPAGLRAHCRCPAN